MCLLLCDVSLKTDETEFENFYTLTSGISYLYLRKRTVDYKNNNYSYCYLSLQPFL